MGLKVFVFVNVFKIFGPNNFINLLHKGMVAPNRKTIGLQLVTLRTNVYM